MTKTKELKTNKLIITVGPPASGKSTWAKKLITENPEGDYIQVELDLMRKEWGVSLKETPKDMLLERDKRVLTALREGKNVIISDTNLSAKALRRLISLAGQAHVKYEINDSFKDVPIEVCIERDQQREESKRVGKEVILSMYARYRDNLPVEKVPNILVIGDVHGEYKKLLHILEQVNITKDNDTKEWVNPNNYKVILLGDLNDPRLSDQKANIEYLSSWKTLCIAKELYDLEWAHLIQSNHQINLIDWYQGHRKNLSYGLDVTVKEIENLINQGHASQVDSVINWLKGLPYYYQFEDCNFEDLVYTCIHASYNKGMSQFHPTGAERADAIYGKKQDEKRLKWWEDAEWLSTQDSILISGHYHEYGNYQDKDGNLKAILLDGGSGSDNGTLYALRISKGEPISTLSSNRSPDY